MSEHNKLTFQLYNINSLIRNFIEDSFDKNGEAIDNIAWEELEKLEMSKNELVRNLILLYKEKTALYNGIKTAEEEIAKRTGYLKHQLEKVKEIIKRNVEEGEKLITPDYEISWRESKSLVYDPTMNLAEVHESDPFLVTKEIVYKVDKTYGKNVYKKTKILPEGFTVEVKNNIQIK